MARIGFDRSVAMSVVGSGRSRGISMRAGEERAEKESWDGETHKVVSGMLHVSFSRKTAD